MLCGGMRQVQIEIEEKEIDIPKEMLEKKRHLLYGKQVDKSVLENYYELQVPSITYQEYLRLDTSLPHVSFLLHIHIVQFI